LTTKAKSTQLAASQGGRRQAAWGAAIANLDTALDRQPGSWRRKRCIRRFWYQQAFNGEVPQSNVRLTCTLDAGITSAHLLKYRPGKPAARHTALRTVRR
jgi:hypothetical protein